MTKTIFILSPGRSGSMSIAKMLEHETTHSVHEPKPHLMKWGYFYKTGKIDEHQARQALYLERDVMIDKIVGSGKVYIESSHFLSPFVKELNEFYPGSKFVVLVRDPIEFVESGMKRGWYTKNDTSEWKWHIWFPLNGFPPDTDRRSKIFWLYNEYMTTIMYDLLNFVEQKNFKIISTNDLNNRKKLDELQEFLGLEFKIRPQHLNKN